MTFSEFCKSQLPDIPDQHIAQMIAGIDVLLFKPSAELRKLAKLAIDTGRRGGVRRGAHTRRDRRRACGERGGSRLAGGARGDQGPLVQHGDRGRPLPLLPQLVRRPEHRVRVASSGTCGRSGTGEEVERPTEELAKRARPARGGVRRAAGRGHPEGVPGAARALAHRLPLRRGAQVLLRLLVPDAVVEQGARVRRAAREARLPRGRARMSSNSVGTRWRRRSTSCPDLGHGRPGSRAARTGRRSSPAARSCCERLGEWTPPPAIGATPEAITDPAVIMLWGVTTAARPGVGERGGGRGRLTARPRRRASWRASRGS